ncbi:MAG: M1 family metallopeptidase [Chloroflexota bacterium]
MKAKLLCLFLILLISFACSTDDSEPQTNAGFVTVTPRPTSTTAPVTDFSLHEQALKPAFATDIDQVVQRGLTHYRIHLTIVPDSLKPSSRPKIQAVMEIRFTNTEPVLLNQVYFRLFPNTPAYGAQADGQGGSMQILDTRLNGEPTDTQMLADNSAMFVPFRRALKPGESNELFIAYEATVPTATGPGNGLYAYDNETLSLSGFYPVIPVFDHNGWHLHIGPVFADSTHTDVALYDITVTNPAQMTLVATGKTMKTTANNDGTVTTHILTGPVRDVYMVLNPFFQSASQEVEGTLVTSYFPPAYRQAGEFALDVGTSALRIYNDIITPYPYREFDLVAVPVPRTLGGVEYPGVIALGQRYYGQIGDQEDRDFMEFVVAHEVAHQWWYGLVGNDQFTYPWLDEALTQYTTIHYYERRYGSGKRAEMINRMFTPLYWQLQDTGGNRPVYGTADEFTEWLYYPVVYGKGPLFFEAVRDQIGDLAYFASLRQYAADYRYGLATPKDLLDTISQTSGQSIDSAYQDWILTD